MGTIARLTMTVRDRAFIQQDQKDRARVRTRFYRSEDQFINAEIYLENDITNNFVKIYLCRKSKLNLLSINSKMVVEYCIHFVMDMKNEEILLTQ